MPQAHDSYDVPQPDESVDYPQDTGGKKVASSFLYNATRSMFEQAGFTYAPPKGKDHCTMRKVVAPS